jgi:hypothetical protein
MLIRALIAIKARIASRASVLTAVVHRFTVLGEASY